MPCEVAWVDLPVQCFPGIEGPISCSESMRDKKLFDQNSVIWPSGFLIQGPYFTT